MTKEQEEAIENLTKLLKQRDEKQIRITTYDLFGNIETVLSMLKQNSAELAEKSAEIEKKDKQIDLMANYIVDLIKYNNPEEKREVEEIKQYFERKAKDGRN